MGDDIAKWLDIAIADHERIIEKLHTVGKEIFPNAKKVISVKKVDGPVSEDIAID
jgi:hypothetical protein